MPEYYERESLIDSLMLYTWRDIDGYEIDNCGAKRAYIEEWLAIASTADVRPVVLCRDCIYAPTAPDDGIESGFDLEWPHDDWPDDNPCPFKCPDKWYSHKPAPDFFCANGVKRSRNE